VIGIVGCAVAAHATSLLTLCVFALLYGASIGMIFPVMEASAMKEVAPERRIAANATFYNFLDIGSGAGPLVFGAIAQSAGYPSAFSPSGLVFVAMLVIMPLKGMAGRRGAHGGS